ncbi:MAG: hypothetical protein EWM73_02793 [Nitrospira sp.]|nr:MAG: hypothetical protein EWM73_02793 [Nitrospira sp.]
MKSLILLTIQRQCRLCHAKALLEYELHLGINLN